MDSVGAVLVADQIRVTTDFRGRLHVTVPLSEPVPYAVGVLTAPPRLAVAFSGPVVVQDADTGPQGLEIIPVTAGSLLTLPLDRARVLDRAEVRSNADGQAVLSARFVKTTDDEFTKAAALWGTHAAQVPEVLTNGPDRLFVMIDPGHGGFDPGAEYGGVREADLVLKMAQALAERLDRAGFAVGLTRDGDQFVSLSERVARANRAGADLFISLHADAVAAGHATGASVHSLPEDATVAGNRFLLQRLGQDALGSTEGTVSDATTRVLMDLARDEALSQGGALADSLVAGLDAGGVALYKTPRKRSNFVVLRAADMPSVLVELGFLSEPADRARLVDPLWRLRVAEALTAGIADWAQTAPVTD